MYVLSVHSIKMSGFFYQCSQLLTHNATKAKAKDLPYIFFSPTHNAHFVCALVAAIVAEKCRLTRDSKVWEQLLQNRIQFHCEHGGRKNHQQEKKTEKNGKIECGFLFQIGLLEGLKREWDIRFVLSVQSKNLKWKATEMEADQRNEVKFWYPFFVVVPLKIW